MALVRPPAGQHITRARKPKIGRAQLKSPPDTTWIDIHLARKRSLTITGTVTRMSENSPPARVLLLSTEGGTQEFATGPGGKFTVAGLTRQVVDVQLDSADKSGVTLTLTTGEALIGTVEIAGDPATIAPTEKFTVRLESLSIPDGFDDAAKGGEVDRDGAFRIERVFPEKFRIRVLPMPENGFVKSVKVDIVETKDDVLDLSRGVGGARIKVTVSRNGGQVEGTVLGDDGEPLHIPFAFVVLAATPDEIDGGSLKPVEAGAKFNYNGLRPGKYRLIGIDPRQWGSDVDVVKAMFPKAPEIEIREGDRITKDVRITAAENADAKP